MSTEATKSKETKKPSSTATFDESGKFVPSSRGNYSAVMKELINRYNEVIDNLALFGDTAVAKHLLYAADISDKPSAIQNLAESTRKLLDDITEELKRNNDEASQAALDALRTKLTEEHDQRRTATNKEYVEALSDKDAQIAMRDRADIYAKDVHDTVNAFVKLFGASLGVSAGIHPLGTTAIRGSVLRKQFRISSFVFTLVTTRPDVAGNLRDTLTVATAEDSKMPKLLSIELELRSNPLAPGLSDKGRDNLDSVMRKMTPNWFRETAPNLTDEELGRIFRDPRAARRYFASLERTRTGGGITLMSLLTPDNGADHTCGPECAFDLASALFGEEDGTGNGFDYVASGPLGSRLFAPRHSGFGSRKNHTTEPQADPYHYDTVKPVDDPDYVQSDHNKE